jgi:hypothetical protein
LKRKPFKLQDLHKNEYDLLKIGYFLHYNNPDSFVCYGRSFEKLLQLELIDKDNLITWNGRALVKWLMPRMEGL